MAGAAEDFAVRARGMEGLGDDGDVALGYPLIDDVERGQRKPAAVVGYPLPPEGTDPRPSSATRRPPPRDKCTSCKMFTKGFLVTLGTVLITDFVLGGLILKKAPHPLLVLLCSPFYPFVCAGLIMLIANCETSESHVQDG
ncbi:hypothetical protein CFC21_049132 [Triticum aestivum]|uniref:Uncharacterized protein n=4 Tax=Triticinae TaxID=1648030 RepID=A0A3B6GYC8_WHEAT|nr:hypothetical protein CFC21_049132 [Triticum aestivum]